MENQIVLNSNDEADHNELSSRQFLLSPKASAHEQDQGEQAQSQTTRKYLDDLQTSGNLLAEMMRTTSAKSRTHKSPPNSIATTGKLPRTGVCYDPRMRFHVEILQSDAHVAFHPEDPNRIRVIYELLCNEGLVDDPRVARFDGVKLNPNPLLRIPSRYATKEECCRIHDEAHFDDLKETAEASDQELYIKSVDGDSVYFSRSTYSAAILAAGSAINTTMAVLKGEVKNAIAVIRPPGHHAEKHQSQGFCHFDNVSVAIKNAQHQNPAIKKVLIIDWDVHHGNGIQNAFWDDPNVLYISLHVHMNGKFYPHAPNGGINYDGGKNAKGANINIAWESQGRTDGDYLMAFQHVIMPVAYEFNPDLVMVASGFDAADGDELGDCHITPDGYSQMTHMLMSLANGKVVVCLEGGYNLEAISVSALAVTRTLMGEAPARISDAIATQSGAKTIFEVIHHHQQYWKSLVPKDRSQQFDAIADATRLHDIVRSVQAQQFFKDYRMFPLPITRNATKKTTSKSYDDQVLANSDFRKAEELLVIFHEQPQLAGAANPVTGKMSLSSPKIVDSVHPFIQWAIKKGFGVIDVNLPDFYTGLSKEPPEKNESDNRTIANAEMQIVSTYLWDNYIAHSSAKKVVLLGVGTAFPAVQRIIATHPAEAFIKQPIKAIGVIEGDPPASPSEPLLHSYEFYYHKWTKIWVPEVNKIFKDLKDGKMRRRYGNLQASSFQTLTDMLQFHKKELQAEILNHFDRPIDPSSGEASDEEVDGQDKSSSDDSGRSALGKRVREEDGEEGSRSARARLSEDLG